MRIHLRLGLGIITLMLPVLALAAPANVTGITATNEDGNVKVSWTQLPDNDIANYRIFYSHASILGNNGVYDDFETADGTVNTHVLETIAPSDELYVAVLAVNGKGEESPYFVEEARVELSPGMNDASSSSDTQKNDGLRLLGAEAISATGVVLRFSHAVTIDQADAVHAIVITKESGATLAIRRFIIENSTVTVHTALQQQNAAYRITLGSAVAGKGPNDTTFPLASDQTPVLFLGHATGLGPQSIPSESPNGTPDVLNLRLTAQPDSDSTYAIEATWQLPESGISALSVSQTTDGGRTYGAPHMIAPDSTALKVPKVPGGSFGILVKTLSRTGTPSRGLAQVIQLPQLKGGVQATVLPQPKPKPNSTTGNLPTTGPAIWVMVAGMSAVTAAWRLRRAQLAR